MTITILTLFPEVFKAVFNTSIIGRAQKNKLIEIKLINIRDFATDKHKSVDDRPYGGGVGMLLRVDTVVKAIKNAKTVKTPRMAARRDVPDGTSRRDSSEVEELRSKYKEKIILLDPKGKLFNQKIARKYSKLDHLILVCGHYEGVDARVGHFADEKISIGEYILTGGEIPAMIVTDAVSRLIPQVLSKKEATLSESFSKDDKLEEPQYTRPPIYKDYKVPEVLLSGHHDHIKKWREKNRKLLK